MPKWVQKSKKLKDELIKEGSSIYDFTANDIKGAPVSLDKYRGHVCIIVNVASKCGYTKSNYEQFVKLYDDYSENKGLCILAFPCNQFGGQEPGDCEQISKFAESRNVKFDMFEKINVNGPKTHPLWTYLKEEIPDKKAGKTIKWNFTKFIIDQEGQPVERYSSATKPLTLLDTLEKYW